MALEGDGLAELSTCSSSAPVCALGMSSSVSSSASEKAFCPPLRHCESVWMASGQLQHRSARGEERRTTAGDKKINRRESSHYANVYGHDTDSKNTHRRFARHRSCNCNCNRHCDA